MSKSTFGDPGPIDQSKKNSKAVTPRVDSSPNYMKNLGHPVTNQFTPDSSDQRFACTVRNLENEDIR